MINYILILLVKLAHKEYWMLPASLIYAQAYHETGAFKSDVYKENKNLFGMKRSVKRMYDTGTNRGHAVFNSRLDSIRDYFERQKQFKINYRNPTQYVADTVKSGYAEDTDYLQKWLIIYEKYKYLQWLSLILIPVIILLVLNFQKLRNLSIWS